MNPPDPSRPIRHFEDFVPRDGGADILQKVRDLDAYLQQSPREYLDGLGLQMLGPAAHVARIRDHENREQDVIMLGSNSYLSLTTHPAVIEASQRACAKYGYGMGAVSLYAGTTDLHRELEVLIAQFYGTEDAVIFPCGYSANVGAISALCGPGDVVMNDAANHASLFDGSRLSGADIRVYLHRNITHLEKILKRLPESRKGRLIITDGVFSMDGDLAPLDRIVELAARYGAQVMIDEAHALGIVGESGRGTAERFGCGDRVAITCGTLSKTPAAVGGYCAGTRALVRYLRYYARTYFFSTSLPAPVVAGLIEVFKLLRADQAGRQDLWRNIHYLRKGLRELGFDTGDTESAVIPVMVGDEDRLARFHNDLRRRGVFTNMVTYPAVRRKECRLRVSVMNSLTIEDMDSALAAFAASGREHGIIR
ncbi:MAG: aminotransferase class I/II-fold pyridoxal phosphate-dependent enzyme [Kiritimatiellae bacterium]|nr:aminotransferase class I/II-fold pyridoxal phosphate-dependent enzyme [Kiritimatiellia bacterium]